MLRWLHNSRRVHPGGYQPRLEGLEDRWLPSVVLTTQPISLFENAAASPTVASFTANDPTPQSNTNYSATINWGDGSSSAGTIAANNSGGFDIQGGHTYAEESIQTVTIAVTDSVDSTSAMTANTVAVADAALTAVSTVGTLNTTEGSGTANRVLATFADPGTDGSANDYKATINWSDGTSSAGTITLNNSGNFDVSGNHLYTVAGNYLVSITFQDIGGGSTSATLNAVVADAALTANGTTLTAQAGQAFAGQVASFTDADPNAQAGNYSVTITWGDGQTSAGTVGSNNAGGFNVFGTNTYAASGNYTVSVQITDNGGSTSAATTSAVIAQGKIFATGADAGGVPMVRVYDASTGNLSFSFLAYSSSFTGGVRVAVGDVYGDGNSEIITAPGPTGAPDIRIFDSRTGAMLGEFLAYNPTFTNGVWVAVGDVNHSGHASIITGPDVGGAPDVRIFDGKTNQLTGEFLAYGINFVGGVRVASADVNGDGFADIITAAGPGGGPHVKVFSGADGSVLQSFFAYDSTFSGGVFVSAGDTNGDGKADIITGAGAGGGPHVKVFSGADDSVLQSFFAYDPSFSAGVRIAAVNVDGDGKTDIVTSLGTGAAPDVKVFDAVTLSNLDNFFAYDPLFNGGVFVGGH